MRVSRRRQATEGRVDETRTRFTEEQILSILKQGDASLKTAEGLSVERDQEINVLQNDREIQAPDRDDVQKLKCVMADLTPDNAVLKDRHEKPSESCKQVSLRWPSQSNASMR